MAISIPNFLTQKSYVGLNTYTYTIAASGMHVARIEVDHREASTMTISITQSGSQSATLATMTLPGGSSSSGAPQATAILKATGNFVAGDVVSFVVTSSASIDQGMNTVKLRLNVHQGSSN